MLDRTVVGRVGQAGECNAIDTAEIDPFQRLLFTRATEVDSEM